MAQILSVSQLTRSVKDLLEAEFPFVRVRGQVSNVGRPASGHLYFSITDGDALLNVVWFKSAQLQAECVSCGDERINPLTGEIEEDGGAPSLASALEDGMEVICTGRINVYEPRGSYQLVAEHVQEQGIGDLRQAFEAMKAKLAEKGYFEEDRKMSPPRDPKRVAVITSPSGAAVRDFIRVSQMRGTGAEIRIYPTLVQGDQAPKQIAEAIRQADSDDWAEILVLIRGGGSLEDLWAFNTEEVADAMFEAHLPIVTGVGHEPDVSIADFVADRRSATPSHAAQELWPSRERLAQDVDRLDIALQRSFSRLLQTKTDQYANLRRGLGWLSPQQRAERLSERFMMLVRRLEDAGKKQYFDKERDASLLAERLERAYGLPVVEQEIHDLRGLMTRLGNAGRSLGTEQVRRFEMTSRQFDRAGTNLLQKRESGLQMLQAALKGLNPEKPLERGYGLVKIEKSGAFLRGPGEVMDGDMLDIRVRDGRVRARVSKGSEDS